jgi:hypothetical protein
MPQMSAAFAADYFYTARLQGEPLESVNDVHSHPAEPRTVRLALRRAVKHAQKHPPR